jgi:hypothetical protein
MYKTKAQISKHQLQENGCLWREEREGIGTEVVFYLD